jgi:hypothetical protein
MRKLGCLITALVLALSLSTVVLAGDIQGPTGCSSPSPAAGDIQTPTGAQLSPMPASGEPSPSAAGEIQMPTATNAEDLSIGEMLLLKVLLTIF